LRSISAVDISSAAVDEALPAERVPADPASGPRPTLSVTVLNYNYGKYLPGCLDSILAQTFRDFEVIVINDCSTDDSVKVIEPYLADPRVRLVDHVKNVGYGGSLVEGSNLHSRGEFLMVISADDVIRSPAAFAVQLGLLRANPGAAFCFSAYETFHEDLELVQRQHSYESDRLIDGATFVREYATRQNVQILHTGTMIRRSAYERAGGYRTDLNICLDFAMWLVLSLEGDVVYSNQVLYGYRAHPQQMSQSAKKAHANVKECISAVNVAFGRARERGMPVAEFRDEALQYILFAIAIHDAFGDRPKLALTRSASALLLEPKLSVKAPGLRVVLARVLAGQRGFAAMRGLLRGNRRAESDPPPPPLAVVARPQVPPECAGQNIVLLINSIMMGGAEEHVRQIATGLARRGANVSVVMPETTEVDPLAESLTRAGVAVERVTLAWMTQGAGTFVRMKRLIAVFRERRAQVAHIHLIGFTGGRWAVAAAALARVPRVIVTMHIAPTETQPLSVRLDRAAQSRFVDRFIAVSQANAVQFRDELGLPASRISVVPNAVELERFAGEPGPDRRRVRAELGIPEDAVVLGALARLNPQKGLGYLIAALPAIVEHHPKVRALLVGSGPLLAELEEQARSLGVAERVTFAGHRSDTVAVLRAMDIALLPSLFEGLPLSLLESMAAALPVVASEVGGIPEVVVDGVSGYLVPPGVPVELAAAVNRLLSEPGALSRMGEQARRRAEDFSYDAMLDRVIRVYAGPD
jgi:glycosyltransferase involved in cell wall biosynthesis